MLKVCISAESLNNPDVKKLMIHNTFANRARISESKLVPVLLAKSILKLAKDPEVGAKVQSLYDEAVVETVNKIEDVDSRNVEQTYLTKKYT